MEKELINQAFGVSPATIYGLLVGFMVIVIITLTIAYVKKDTKLTEVMKEHNEMVKQSILMIDKLSLLSSPEARKKDFDNIILYIKNDLRDFLDNYKN